MRILILEDDYERISWFGQTTFPHEVKWAIVARDAISLLKNNTFDLIFLDHDLSNEHYSHYISSLANDEKWIESKFDEDSGFAVAKFLRENPELSPRSQIVIHTMNPVAQRRMAYELQDRNAKVIPFSKLRKEINLLGTIR